MHKLLVPLLACPACQGGLKSQVISQDETHITEGEFVCASCGRKYPVIDSIGIFLDTEKNRNDLWKQQEDFKTRFRREHPIRFFFLTKTPLGNLKPEHYFLKGLLLEDERVLERAMRRIYSKDYLVGYEKMRQALMEIENDNPSLILEIACGRGGFLKHFLRLRHGSGIYVASDFSLTILRRNLRWLRNNGFLKHVTLMAFDAKAMPFKDNSIPAVVSNLGFPNIQNDGKAVSETFRVLAPSGTLITNFMFTTKETENYVKAKEYGLDEFYIQESTEEAFRRTGFSFKLEELHHGRVNPTPGGIDFLPVVADIYSFSTVKAIKP